MRQVIDLECVLPPDEKGIARQYFGTAGHRIGEGDPELLPPLAGYGFDNYRNIFTRREGGARQPAAAKPAGKSLAQIVAEMDRDGVQVSVIHRMPNDLLARIVQAHPTRFFGLATLSPFDGMRGVRELERLVREAREVDDRLSAARTEAERIRTPATLEILGRIDEEDLLETIRAVHAGVKRIHPEVAAELAAHAADDPLTAREIEVLSLIAAGNANKLIADQLSISEDTVKGHVKSILSKLDARDRTHAVTVGLKRGIIQL